MSAALTIDAGIDADLRALELAPDPALEPDPDGSETIAAQLLAYLNLLGKWNRVYNLTAITSRDQMVTHHILDSLSIVKAIDHQLVGIREPRILDVGTGAGLPGIPLAIVRPRWQVTMVDSISKKTAFVTQAAAELRLPNTKVVNARIEDFTERDYDLIVSRAYASLQDFVGQTRALLADSGVWAAMKGGVPIDELRALPSDIGRLDVLQLRVPRLDAERHLILLKVKR